MSTIWEWIKSFFSRLLQQFKEFVNDALSEGSKLIVAELKEFAVEIVASLSLSDLTDAEKRATAIERIKAEALARGKEVSESLAAFIVELAYQYFQTNNVADDIS